jgi:hypothetical protein
VTGGTKSGEQRVTGVVKRRERDHTRDRVKAARPTGSWQLLAQLIFRAGSTDDSSQEQDWESPEPGLAQRRAIWAAMCEAASKGVYVHCSR